MRVLSYRLKKKAIAVNRSWAGMLIFFLLNTEKKGTGPTGYLPVIDAPITDVFFNKVIYANAQMIRWANKEFKKCSVKQWLALSGNQIVNIFKL